MYALDKGEAYRVRWIGGDLIDCYIVFRTMWRSQLSWLLETPGIVGPVAVIAIFWEIDLTGENGIGSLHGEGIR